MHSKHSSALPLGGPRRTALSSRMVQTGQSRHPNRTHACALGPASCCSTSQISASISPHRAPCYRDRTRFLLSHTQPNHCFRFTSSQHPITHLPDPHTPHMDSTHNKTMRSLRSTILRFTTHINTAAPPFPTGHAPLFTSHCCSNNHDNHAGMKPNLNLCLRLQDFRGPRTSRTARSCRHPNRTDPPSSKPRDCRRTTTVSRRNSSSRKMTKSSSETRTSSSATRMRSSGIRTHSTWGTRKRSTSANRMPRTRSCTPPARSRSDQSSTQGSIVHRTLAHLGSTPSSSCRTLRDSISESTHRTGPPSGSTPSGNPCPENLQWTLVPSRTDSALVSSSSP